MSVPLHTYMPKQSSIIASASDSVVNPPRHPIQDGGALIAKPIVNYDYLFMSKQEYDETEACLRSRKHHPSINLDDNYEPRLVHPFTMIIAGPTSCGKSIFCLRLLRHTRWMITIPPERIVYCYSEYQPMFDQFEDVEFHEGLPNEDMFDGCKPTLLIIDDLMTETNEVVTKLFTKMSHHRGVSVIYLTQNLFSKNKHNRTISLNAHYMVLFKNIRDVTQIHTLARQMFPGASESMMAIYRDATSVPFGYLLVDLTQKMQDVNRLRTDIFPGEREVVYKPIKC
jgi:hypothetical protein